MAKWIDTALGLSDNVTEKTYRLTFSYPEWLPFPPPPNVKPFTTNFEDWIFDVSDFVTDYRARKVMFTLTVTKRNKLVKDAAIPVNLVLVTVAGAVGIVFAVMALDKIEELVETPAGSLIPLALLLAAGAYLLSQAKAFKSA